MAVLTNQMYWSRIILVTWLWPLPVALGNNLANSVALPH